jgi:chromosome segregation ATPase
MTLLENIRRNANRKSELDADKRLLHDAADEIEDACAEVAELRQHLAKARAVLHQVRDVCEDNMAAGCDAHMALRFIWGVVDAANLSSHKPDVGTT